MPGLLLLLLMLLLQQLLSISSSKVHQGAIKSPRRFDVRNVQSNSNNSDPSLFDGVFAGACAFSFGFSDPDDAGSRQCTRSNGVCLQQYSVEFHDTGKDAGLPGAIFSRGFFPLHPRVSLLMQRLWRRVTRAERLHRTI